MIKTPEAVEIEKKLLSAMMLKEGEIIPMVSAILKPSDFYRAEHQLFYRIMLKIYAQKTPPDVLLIEEELRRIQGPNKLLRDYLFGLIDEEWTTARAEQYATIIKEKSVLRRLIEYGEELVYEAGEEQKSAAELLEMAGSKILSMTLKTNQTQVEPLEKLLPDVLRRIAHKALHPNEITGVRTKIIGLDRVLNGLQKTDMIILAARPSMGKTALALNIARNAAMTGANVVIFSLEMSKSQLVERLISTVSGINSFKLKTGNITDDEMAELLNSVDDMEGLNLYLDDTPGLTQMEMRTKVRRLKHEFGIDLIVIDYLQLMQGMRAENRQQEISEISRNLKALAREMDVPILALSQLSRSVEMRADKKPQLSDLRESGSLEQDADVVMFLYRDEYYNRDDDSNKNIAELIIAKNRNGPTTSIGLQFDKETMRFGDLIMEK